MDYYPLSDVPVAKSEIIIRFPRRGNKRQSKEAGSQIHEDEPDTKKIILDVGGMEYVDAEDGGDIYAIMAIKDD